MRRAAAADPRRGALSGGGHPAQLRRRAPAPAAGLPSLYGPPLIKTDERLLDVHPRVLVVEDDEDIAQALQRSLRMEGYEVRRAGDGEEALEQARTSRRTS